LSSSQPAEPAKPIATPIAIARPFAVPTAAFYTAP